MSEAVGHPAGEAPGGGLMAKGKHGMMPGLAFSVRKPGESVREINGALTNEARRRARIRRSIEEKEAEFRRCRELREIEGDW